jgi:hypothetical protein
MKHHIQATGYCNDSIDSLKTLHIRNTCRIRLHGDGLSAGGLELGYYRLRWGRLLPPSDPARGAHDDGALFH